MTRLAASKSGSYTRNWLNFLDRFNCALRGPTQRGALIDAKGPRHSLSCLNAEFDSQITSRKRATQKVR